MTHRSVWLVALLFGCGAPVRDARPPEPVIARCSDAGLPTSVHAPAFLAGPSIPAAEVRADFDGWLAQMAATHPDLGLRTDRPAFERVRGEIAASITRPMTAREAWLQFARLNPTLRDGHNGIAIGDREAVMKAHVAAGGRFVPLEVHLGSDDVLRVQTAPPGAAGLARGTRIAAINGHPAEQIVAEMMMRAAGDTPAFRREVVARRFPLNYWLLFGDTGNYAITVAAPGDRCPQQVIVEGATELPSLAPVAQRAEQEFGYKVLEGSIGYLRAGDFDPAFGDAFAAFTRRAFTELEARGIRALIIDVRDNGGGDDPLWQQGLVEHITRTPYTHVGWYAIRVTKKNADPGDVIGEVQRKENKRRIAPSAVDPLRFAGPVYILAGPFSYSSTIQFLVAAQDFGIARIAGRETGGLSCQTGQVTVLDMPHTGLRAYTPVAAFTRPAGHGCERGVIPDVAIDDVGLDPDRAPALLAREIAAALDRPGASR